MAPPPPRPPPRPDRLIDLDDPDFPRVIELLFLNVPLVRRADW